MRKLLRRLGREASGGQELSRNSTKVLPCICSSGVPARERLLLLDLLELDSLVANKNTLSSQPMLLHISRIVL